MSQVDSQAFSSLNIPPGQAENWNEVKTKYLARKSVITRKIKMWSGRLESTKLTKETARGASILDLSDMVKKARTDLCAEMSLFEGLVADVTKILTNTMPQESEENLTIFNTVMESIDTVATNYITDIIQCMRMLGNTYLVDEEKKTSIPARPALDPVIT